MSLSSYHALTLDWSPASSADRRFIVIAGIVLTVAFAIGLLLSSIPVPKEERQARQEIPERIANLLLQKKKPPPPKPPEPKTVEKPKPKEPEPEKPKPQVKKPKPVTPEKPLNKKELAAREKAEQTGLLALQGQLKDLMQTDDIRAMVAGDVTTVAPVTINNDINTNALLADAGQGSGGVADATTIFKPKVVSRTELAKLERVEVKQKLVSKQAVSAAASKDRETRNARSGVRAEEDVTLVFDRNKSKLYDLYSRARRQNPGLKGKIILSITIAASGKVTAIKIVSSELDDKKLERRLLQRIRNFDFGAKQVEPVTVTYPIEFLPS